MAAMASGAQSGVIAVALTIALHLLGSFHPYPILFVPPQPPLSAPWLVPRGFQGGDRLLYYNGDGIGFRNLREKRASSGEHSFLQLRAVTVGSFQCPPQELEETPQ